jgi:hypothetical protein
MNRFVPNLTGFCTIYPSMTMTSLIRIRSGIRISWGFFVLNGISHYKLKKFASSYLIHFKSKVLKISQDMINYCMSLAGCFIAEFNRIQGQGHTQGQICLFLNNFDSNCHMDLKFDAYDAKCPSACCLYLNLTFDF